MKSNRWWTWSLAGLLCAAPAALAAPGGASNAVGAAHAPNMTAAHPGPGGGPGMRGGGGRGMRGGMHDQGMRGMWGPRMMAQLELTAQQREKITQLRDAQQRKGIQARADMQLASLDLHKLMRADKPDQRAINAQIDRVSSLRAAMQKSHVAAMLSMRAVLTDEQRAKLSQLREQGPPMRGRGAGPGWGRGGTNDDEED
ncbi:MAG: hypothetical protein A2W00_07805 [Candidatus Eisenbacteria bacterium RBG_16_71_46]|nr:MAG: hypothetical protein A2W00_07805 [Candidatus Eisenbacteria bacterium RBG_16_71_46]